MAIRRAHEPATSQFVLSNVAVRVTCEPESTVISRDQSLKPAIVTTMVCLPGLSFNVAGVLPTKSLSTFTSAPVGVETNAIIASASATVRFDAAVGGGSATGA